METLARLSTLDLPFGWETGKHVVHNSYIWITALEHGTEDFGKLVVYYRANNMVPPESPRRVQWTFLAQLNSF